MSDFSLPPGTTFEKNEAAIAIQKAWKSHVDRQIFQFYKNLIGFHTQSLAKNLKNKIQSSSNHSIDKKHDVNPNSSSNITTNSLDTSNLQKSSALVTATSTQCASTVMRLICPKEAQFMDDAAGTHVRFRLASPSSTSKFGTFPPAVYYKIYTHRPIVDLCATAPRNYTQAANKQTLPMQRFNRETITQDVSNVPKINNIKLNLGGDETAGWYRRFENNSWRPISEKLLLASLYSAPMAPGSFKPTVDQRRIKKSNEKKRKRIAWLRKIYFSAENPISYSDETLIESAIDNMAILADEKTCNKIENNPLNVNVHDLSADIDDEDVQALIEWTDCLADFDDYQNYWTHLGTAGFPSIEILGERSQSEQNRREDKLRKLGSVINSSEEKSEKEQLEKEIEEVGDLEFLTLEALES